MRPRLPLKSPEIEWDPVTYIPASSSFGARFRFLSLARADTRYRGDLSQVRIANANEGRNWIGTNLNPARDLNYRISFFPPFFFAPRAFSSRLRGCNVITDRFNQVRSMRAPRRRTLGHRYDASRGRFITPAPL